MATALPNPQGRFSQGMALLLVEGTALAYALCIVRGTWPPGHPFSALLGLIGAWYEGLMHFVH